MPSEILGSFSNNDGDRNGYVKKAIESILAKQQLCTCIRFFCSSLPSLHDYDVKMPNCKFHGGRKQATTNLFFYTYHFQQIGINTTTTEKMGIHFKTDVFAAVAVVDAKAFYW